MELYIPSNGPFIFALEDNKMRENIVNLLRDSFVELDKGRNIYPTLYLWNETKIYIFLFNTLSEEKFLKFYNKFFFEKYTDSDIAYKNLGINLLEFLAREKESGIFLLLTENIDRELYSKKSEHYSYIDVDLERYELTPKEFFEIQSAFKNHCEFVNLSKRKASPPLKSGEFSELFIKFNDSESYKIGFIYLPTEQHGKKFVILTVPKTLYTHHQNFLKKLMFSFNSVGLQRNVYKFRYAYFSSAFPKFFDGINQITIGADFEFELYDKINDTVVSARNILLDTIYKNKYYANLKRNKIGVDGNSSIGELRTTPVRIVDLNKFFKDVDRLVNRTKKKISEIFNHIDVGFIGKKYPIGFHIHFGVGKQILGTSFNNLPVEEINYFEKSIESLLSLILYRYLYTLNSFRRWDSVYSTYNGYEKSRKKRYGIEYRLFPSSIILEDFYKVVISFAVDLIRNYFTKGNIIRIPLNEYYEIDEEFYPKEFFDKLWKVKELVKLNDGNVSYYELLTKKFTRFERESTEFLKCWSELEEMVNLLNNDYLKKSFLYLDYYNFDSNSDVPFYKAREYYDIINRKPITLYSLALPRITVWGIVSNGYNKEFSDTIYEMLKEMEIRGQLKTTHKKLWKEFLNRFKFLKVNNQKAAV